MEMTIESKTNQWPPIPKSNVTIYNVAEKAGVSTATVSRILAGFVFYRPETRERVLNAVRELGYTPNIQAQNLALGRSARVLQDKTA
jgi:LacI family transcriptional regulator